MNLFAPLVFSSVIAAMVSRSFFGIEPWYKIPPFRRHAAATAVVCAAGRALRRGGALFLKLLRLGEQQFCKLNWRFISG